MRGEINVRAPEWDVRVTRRQREKSKKEEEMKAGYACGMLGVAVLLLTGCASTIYPGGPTPAGSLVTSVRSPAQALAVALDPSASASRKGEASSSAVLGLFATGDASVDAAMRNGKITKIHHVDHDVNLFLGGLYIKATTIVYGE